jgi:hypothetical protein
MVKEEAHRGLLRLIPVKKAGLAGAPGPRLPLQITMKGDLRKVVLPVLADNKEIADPSLAILLFHDRRADTLTHDFTALGESCGRCHPEELAEFRRSAMGMNAKQSRYSHWQNSTTGPHNCGVWFDGNVKRIAAETAVPFTLAESDLNQRSCNTCHVGCLDCHYAPEPKDSKDLKRGVHTFRRIPPPQNCYGGGRGTTCHAGPEERRRGAGYFGSSYSYPEGATADVHRTAGVGCLDCHPHEGTDTRLGHGVIKRQARCDGCHGEVVRSHASSPHRRVSCEACHIQNVGGYQASFWGPGTLAGSATPYFKYKDYYGVMAEPILIRDQRGRWIPVKPYAMAVMNQKGEMPLKPGLRWRYPLGGSDLSRTDDAWGMIGMVDGLPANNKALLWLQLDKLSHKYGPSRSCDSCHTIDGSQQQEVRWEYADAGAFPFNGKHLVVADKKGLAIIGMTASTEIELLEGSKVADFAPWRYLGDRWRISGDFALPLLADRKRYDKLREEQQRWQLLVHDRAGGQSLRSK